MLRDTRVWILLAAMLFAPVPQVVHAYTPKSEEVQAMIDKAIPVLENGWYTEPGGNALIALALLKADRAESRVISRAATECVQWVSRSQTEGLGPTHYGPSLIVIFLSELDKSRYRPQVQTVITQILRSQQSNGCWGYLPTHSYDDTSQSQYCVLALWSAHHAGIQIPAESVERAMMWFTRVQDVGGGWAYQSNDPKSPQRVQQGGVSHSMASAGLSSVYICADILGFKTGTPQAVVTTSVGGLPAVLRRKESAEEKAEKTTAVRPVQTNSGMISSTLALGNQWFAKNLTYHDVPNWTHYYMYGVERYKSFQELIEGKTVDEPEWYNQGVEYLRRTQLADGSWHTEHSHAGSPAIDTAFAVLFLTRSTKKAIAKTEKGRMIGAKGLPPDLSQVRIEDGKVVSDKDTPPVEKLLAMLEDPNNPQGDFIFGMPDELELSADVKTRATQTERLRRMVINGSWQARRTAAKTLSRHRDLENVPALIYALGDLDPNVVAAAQDGLRFISRRFTGNELPEGPTRAQAKAAQEGWKQWFLTVRPDAVFVE